MDVEQIGADAYVIAPYKNFGVKGCGYAHATDRLARLPHWKYLTKPETSWDLGGVEHQSYAAWSAVVDYLSWLGGHFTESRDRRTLVVTAMTRVKAHLEGLLSVLLHGTNGVPGVRDMPHVTVYGMGEDLSRQSLLVGFNVDGVSATDACDHYRAHQLRLHAAGHDPFFGAMLQQIGVTSFVRLSGSHYNTPQDIERFLTATASFVPAPKTMVAAATR